MYTFKLYSINDQIKKKLAFIIREMRLLNYQKNKAAYLIEKNPFTKENFCEKNAICHYHTLTKLEREEIVKDDNVYHKFLDKLGLQFQVTYEQHKKLMELLNKYTERFLLAVEYVDFDQLKIVMDEIATNDFHNDCIALYYVKLLEIMYHLQVEQTVAEEQIRFIELFVNFFEGVYQGLVYHALGLYHHNLNRVVQPIEYYQKAIEIYKQYQISMGFINSILLSTYKSSRNYFNLIMLCQELEIYYIEHQNYRRLLHVYNYLMDFYILVNSMENAETYFNKALNMIDQYPDLNKYRVYLYHNWGMTFLKNYQFENAIKYFKLSYEYNENKNVVLQTLNLIIISLSKLKRTEEVNQYLQLGESYYQYSSKIQQAIFDFYRYKYTNQTDKAKQIALDKIIPKIKYLKPWNEVIIFIYDELL